MEEKNMKRDEIIKHLIDIYDVEKEEFFKESEKKGWIEARFEMIKILADIWDDNRVQIMNKKQNEVIQMKSLISVIKKFNEKVTEKTNYPFPEIENLNPNSLCENFPENDKLMGAIRELIYKK